jgi:mRNA interferase MazF
MSKDFNVWNSRKIIIHEDSSGVFFHEREVWFASLGLNIGFEQDGKGGDFLRPVVIIKKFNNNLLWAVPTTSKPRYGKYYMKISFGIRDKYTNAILSQIRPIDSKRLKYKVGIIDNSTYSDMKKHIISLLS